MPKSNKDVTKIFKSLGPGDNMSKAVANASVKEMEQRWPLLKTTPPHKLEQTPVLSEDERQHWLSSPKTRSDNRKQVLSVPSATSKDMLALSLKRMAGHQTKAKLSVSVAQTKPEASVPVPGIKLSPQLKSDGNVAKSDETEILPQLNKTAEVQTDIKENSVVEVRKRVVNTTFAKDKTAVIVKKVVPELAPAPIDESRSLRGIFGRLSEKKNEPPPLPPVAAVKSSVLKKLSKR